MIDYSALAPEIFLAFAICAVLVTDIFLKPEQRRWTYTLSMIAIVLTALVSVIFTVDQTVTTFSGSFVSDPASVVLKTVPCRSAPG